MNNLRKRQKEEYIEKLKSLWGGYWRVCTVSLLAQTMCIVQVVIALKDRKVAMVNLFDWIMRLFLAHCIFNMIYSDFNSIETNYATKKCGLTGEIELKHILVQMWRMVITIIALIAISWYLITTDIEGEETNLDLVKDFTALMIIIEIDNMIQPLKNVSFEELNVHRAESLERRFLRYK